MFTDLPSIKDLPHQSASQVKNRWASVARLVQQTGSVAITNHSVVEMVLLDAATYQQFVDEIQAFKAREQTDLDRLDNRFRSRLTVLQQPDAAEKVDALFAAKGKLTQRPKAGTSY
jgi:hypothetical protein